MNNNDFQKQLAKLRRNKRFLWFGVLFFVLVILWILVSIFATTKTSSISPELRDLSKSFVPRLESKVFDNILIKRFFSEDELSTFPIYIFDRKNIDEEDNLIDITAPIENSPEESNFGVEPFNLDENETSSTSAQESENPNQLEEETQEPTSTDQNTYMPIPVEAILGL